MYILRCTETGESITLTSSANNLNNESTASLKLGRGLFGVPLSQML
jgi:hypothetical protein